LRTKPQIALTFHANGDVALTTKLFGEAEARNVPLTIFAVGSWLVANPTMAARILHGGHELANHTYSHPSLGQLAAAAVGVEISKCRDVIKTQTGQVGGWFRPSGIDVPTALILDEAGRAGYRTVIGYDVDPLDYQDPGAAAVLQRVKAGMQMGSIVSLHTGHLGTVDALPGILDAISAASLQPVTVSTLLS
jgi:peptidoglycan/xylan/chitin deacetylase (PgdA/CDA1 family)